MLVPSVIALFVVVPLLVHHRTFDIATGSAASGLTVGVVCGVLAFFRQGAAQGVAAFFFAVFVGFGIAYVVGLIYKALGSDERRNVQASKPSAHLSRRRQALGACGALAIPSTVFGFWALHGWQTGEWDSVPAKPALGFLAFFVLGIVALINLYVSRSQK